MTIPRKEGMPLKWSQPKEQREAVESEISISVCAWEQELNAAGNVCVIKNIMHLAVQTDTHGSLGRPRATLFAWKTCIDHSNRRFE